MLRRQVVKGMLSPRPLAVAATASRPDYHPPLTLGREPPVAKHLQHLCLQCLIQQWVVGFPHILLALAQLAQFRCREWSCQAGPTN